MRADGVVVLPPALDDDLRPRKSIGHKPWVGTVCIRDFPSGVQGDAIALHCQYKNL
jgi:hypothetical protein